MRRILGVIAIVGVLAALAYLRDPPWLATMDSGFRGWETTADGRRYRSMAGHASFFVPADARGIVVPVRMGFPEPGDPPVRVEIAIDDRAAEAIVLRDDSWVSMEIRLPPPRTRSLRRIDIRADRLRPGMRGPQIGEVNLMK